MARDPFNIYDLPDTDRTWMKTASCRGSTANFFPSQMGERGVREAIAICNQCPVRIRCLDWSINNNITHGIWGGLTSRARREYANARAYLVDDTRQEHKTAWWYQHYLQINDPDPTQRTSQTLGLSKAAVYHHLRIDRIAKGIIDDDNRGQTDNSDDVD